MIRFHRKQTSESVIESAGRSVSLVSVETAVWVATRWFAFGAMYRRPAWVEVAGNDDARLAIRDPVMFVKIAVLALPVAALTRRLLR